MWERGPDSSPIGRGLPPVPTRQANLRWLVRVDATPLSEEHNQAIIRRLFEEVWNCGDLAAADEIVDPKMVDHVTRPGNLIGSEGFKQTVTMFRSAFPDIDGSRLRSWEFLPP